MVGLAAVVEAATLLKGRCRNTEMIPSHYFSAQTGTPVHFKCENLQRTGSFKIRGALNFVLRQEPERLSRGVIAASAGNHAQGVAFAARQLGIPAVVVMPETTPLAKLLATRAYGAEVVLHGIDFDTAVDEARRLANERDLLPVPAFDDPLIIAGQGTIALEVLENLPETQTLVVPIGGGGLISGIAAAARALRPGIRIVGVQAAGVPTAAESRRRGEAVTMAKGRTLADGIAVRRLGDLTYPMIENLVDDIITVGEEEIAQSIVSLLEKGKLVVEGAGAVTLAALLYRPPSNLKGPAVCVLSGGNIDVQTLSRVVERGMLAEGRYLKVRVELADAPGALAALANEVARSGANIYKVSHDRRSSLVPLGRAEVHLELETKGPEHMGEVLEALRLSGYDADILR